MKELKEPQRGYGRGRILGAFVIGATTGSLAALLFAPASGRVTRRRIGLKIRSLQRGTVRQLEQAKRLVARKAETIREAASEKLSNAREWVAGHVSNGQHRRTVRHHV